MNENNILPVDSKNEKVSEMSDFFNTTFAVNSQYNGAEVLNTESVEVLDNNSLEVLDDAPVVALDPHKNANNPIPVNPVAPVEEEDFKYISMNFKDILNLFIGIFIKPISNIKDNAKRYSEIQNCFKLTLIITLISIILSLIGSLIVGGFGYTIDPLTGGYSRGFSIENIMNINFLNYIFKGILISGGVIFIFSLVYYAASFMNNKGVKFGTYLMISNLSFFPFIIGGSLLYPIGNLFSIYIALCLLVLSVIYTMIIYITGVNELLVFKSIDRKAFYNLFNIILIVVIVMIVFYLLLQNGMIEIPVNIII